MGRRSELPRRFRRSPRKVVLGVEMPVATTYVSRLLGLALLAPERAGPGLLIPRCRNIHTFGMRYRIDVIFLGKTGQPIDLRRFVSPARIVRCRAAAAVLERPSSTCPNA
jgi:hypothetical protein